jgi:FKBP-type peptidyl-prolyl cis-trans isomerase
MNIIICLKIGGISLFAAILLTSCLKDDSQEQRDQEMKLLNQYLIDNGIVEEPTESGLYYIPLRTGWGITPKYEDWVEIQYTGELLDGTVFNTSYEDIAERQGIYQEGFLYGPARFQLGYINLAGLNEGISYMMVGELAKFILPSDLALGGVSSGRIPEFSTLVYTIELVAAFDDPQQYEQELQWAYLKAGSFENVDSTESGLYYIEEVPGSGDFIEYGDTIDVWYTGTFLDGRQFDNNVGQTAFSFIFPGQNIIEGWQEGIKLMRDGGKGILIIPYDLAYGSAGFVDDQGRVGIPPYMTLVYELEVKKYVE